MKVAIILAALVCYTCAQTTSGPTPTRSATELKQELLTRAAQLDVKVKAEIQSLVSQGREHLSTLLKEEEQRVQTLVSNLQKATDVVQLAVLETELIDMEFRVDNEVNILQRETATQELLLNNARVLKQWVTDEIKKLDATEGENKRRAEFLAREFRREEEVLTRLVERLTGAQNQREIEILEVELRAVEVRIYEALRAVHYNPNSTGGTTAPAGTTKPAGTQTRPPTTRVPVTNKPTTRPPVPTTRAPGTTAAH